MKTVPLKGDFSLSGVQEQHPELLEAGRQLAIDVMTCDDPAELAVQLDFTTMEQLDACGCQLIAAFLQQLRKAGLTNITAEPPDAMRQTIQSLGFGDEILTGKE